MNRNTKRIAVYATLSLIFTAIAVGFRSAACLYDLDYIYGYFASKTAITVATVLIAAGALVSISYGFVGAKSSLLPSFSSPATFIPTGVVGAALIFFAIGMLKRGFATLGNGAPITASITAFLCAILAALSVVHFFLNAFLTEGKTELRAWFAIATVGALATYAAYVYFDSGIAINAPTRITDQMAFLAAALFFLYEARISLGREKWRGYVVLGLVSSSLCAYSAIPSLVVYFVRDVNVSLSLEESLLTLALTLFITTRILLAIRLPENEENKRIAAIKSLAQDKKHTADDTNRRYDEAYAVQLTIEDIIDEGEMPEEPEYEPTEEFIFPAEEAPSTVFVTEEDEDDGQMELIDIFRNDTNEADEDTEATGDS